MRAQKNRKTALVTLIAALCLAMACVSLAACGGSGQPASGGKTDGSSAPAAAAAPAAAETSAPAEAAAPAAAPAAEPAAQNQGFVGSWKMAAAESQGITMAGDFGELIGTGSSSIDMTIEEGGTGSMTFNGESKPFTWTQDSDDTITITIENTDEEGSIISNNAKVTLKDGALFLEIASGDQSSTLILTADGNYAGARKITLDGATPVTSEDQLVGTWKMVGMNMAGISMYGDADALAATMGGTDTSATFEAGGKAVVYGSECTYTVSSEGAVLKTTGLEGEVECPLVMIGDELAIDYSAAMGGMQFIMLMAKA